MNAGSAIAFLESVKKCDRPFLLFLKKGRSPLKIVSFQECRIQSQTLHLEYTAAKLSGDRRRLDG